jgi:hypothetical protein
MKLTDKQSDQVIAVWNSYAESGGKYVYPATGYSHLVLDQHRLEIIPEIRKHIDKFINGSSTIDEFKTGIVEANKKNLLWGFQGLNGQTFFEAVAKSSVETNLQAELNNLFKETLPSPVNTDFAVNNIRTFSKFVLSLAKGSADLLSVPRTGAIPYFLSYFWQIQKPETWPIYYTSLVGELNTLDIWSPAGDIALNYGEFCELNGDLLDLIETRANRKIKLWDLEHAFYHSAILRDSQAVREPPAPVEAPLEKAVAAVPKQNLREDTPTVRMRRKTGQTSHIEKKTGHAPRSEAKPIKEEARPSYSESYIPPVVALLPALAVNDSQAAAQCAAAGKSVEKVFEERLDTLFRMLGYEIRTPERGNARGPAGIAACGEHHYAIIYDARISRQGYALESEADKLRDYIIRTGDKLYKQNFRMIYYMVISSAFSGEIDSATRSLKIETGLNEVILAEVKALLQLLEMKMRDPAITLGPRHIQKLLAATGVLSAETVREYFD